MQSHPLLALSLVSLLAACGGGGSGALGSSALPGPPEFNALVLEAEAQAEKLDTLVATTTLPGADGVAYSGTFLAIESLDDAGDALVSSLNLTMNFGSETMTGDASDFYLVRVDSEGDATGPASSVAGSLDFASSNVSTGGFDVQMSGDLFFEGALRDASGDALGGALGQTSSDVDMVTFIGEISMAGTSTTLLGAGTAD